MDVLRHNHCAVQQDGLVVRVETAFEDDRAGLSGQGIAGEFAEGDEEWATGILKVWQAAVVLVGVRAGRMNHVGNNGRHSCPPQAKFGDWPSSAL